ncbi:hypothetical protein DVH24_036561 [Malus domestica]|uniref:Uncharacterized protein n=1 Tax=Malus domestica TaxID=3750 RepID=A0A498IGA4_MALDO|nr:hypothetical protein DVH24_036561 [Malus domestica]
MASSKSNHEAPYTNSDTDRPFRGNLRQKHGDLASVQGINLFFSLSTTTFLFVSPNFVDHLNLTKFLASPVAFEAFFGQTTFKALGPFS